MYQHRFAIFGDCHFKVEQWRKVQNLSEMWFRSLIFRHVPFRDSKLTKILQPSLGGNSRTAIICTASPSSANIHTTISTLRFALRAKQVRNYAKVNQVSGEDALLRKHHNKIVELNEQLGKLHSEQEVKKSSGHNDLESLKFKKTLELQIQHLKNLILVNTSPTKGSTAKVGIVSKKIISFFSGGFK
jgi:hypothetical protein